MHRRRRIRHWAVIHARLLAVSSGVLVRWLQRREARPWLDAHQDKPRNSNALCDSDPADNQAKPACTRSALRVSATRAAAHAGERADNVVAEHLAQARAYLHDRRADKDAAGAQHARDLCHLRARGIARVGTHIRTLHANTVVPAATP